MNKDLIVRLLKIIVILLLALPFLGCRKNGRLGTLAVDIYLHPESGSSEDILLQTAIRKNLGEHKGTDRGVYARVLDLRVVLSGTVAKAAMRDEAEQIARSTRVTLNETAITPKDVTNRIRVEP